ncbi:MAG: CRISPR-associated helicase Cas3' [Pyrinomonadaceae bacterium]
MNTPHPNIDLYIFWAKTSHDAHNPHAFHPLLCHMIDVAIVAREMWRQVLPGAARHRIAQAFGLDVDSEVLEAIVAWIAGLHDLGKASPPFALRDDSRATRNLHRLYTNTPFKRPLHVPQAREAPHGYVTATELPYILIEDFGFPPALADGIGILIGGHHGVFPRSEQTEGIRNSGEKRGSVAWANARRALAIELAALLVIPMPVSLAYNLALDNATTMILAGVVSVADWIGSNATYFQCASEVTDSDEPKRIDAKDYLNKATGYARKALGELGWLGWPEPEAHRKFEELFPQFKNYSPRDLQTQAVVIARKLDAPGIVVIEAPMGEGKTEAAMYLADHLNAQLNQRGSYFALPTQATSNQMFKRVREFLEQRYPNKNVLFQLLHGHAALSAEFQLLREEGDKAARAFDVQQIDDDEKHKHSDCTPSVVAAEWFTHRKRGLLAPFGVGTVDQALMAVLQTKHVFVRLFGLAHKTVIVDEVHAYDAYMSTLLERLLEWLAALASPVVLLSATLPRKRRDDLIKAYLKGLGSGNAIQPQTNEVANEQDRYPRISWATAETRGVRHIQTSAQNTRILNLEWVDGRLPKDSSGVFALGEKLEEALKDGGCAAVICNTVQRAQDVYKALKSYFPIETDDGLPLDLLHARYLFKDRADREARTLHRFGKEGASITGRNGYEHLVSRPRRAVLVSTQIIEQSLDLDFDLMVTDIAPVDLILQRAGRLHRHERKKEFRPPNLQHPTLWICEPEIKPDSTPDFGVSEYVYDRHILLRSWLAVRDRANITIPDEIEELIESVYDAERVCTQSEFEKVWYETKDKMREKLKRKEANAKNVRLSSPLDEELLEDFNQQLEEDNPAIHKSLQAQTRDDETPSVSVVFLTHAEILQHSIAPKPDLETISFFLQRSVNLAMRRAVDVLLNEQPPTEWQETALLRHHRLIKLNENGEQQIGDYLFRVHPELGVVIDKITEEKM